MNCYVGGKNRELRDVKGNSPRTISTEVGNKKMDVWYRKQKLIKEIESNDL